MVNILKEFHGFCYFRLEELFLVMSNRNCKNPISYTQNQRYRKLIDAGVHFDLFRIATIRKY